MTLQSAVKNTGKGKSKSPLPPLFQRGESHVAFISLRSETFRSERDGWPASGSTRSQPCKAAPNPPPLKKGGRGDLLSAPTNQLTPNHLKHGMRLLQDLVIVETNDLQSQPLKVSSTLCVRLNSDFRQMLRTVDLDAQPDVGQVEINDVGTDWLLPIAGDSIQLLPAKIEPEPVLGVRHSIAKAACESFEGWVISEHASIGLSSPRFAHAHCSAPESRELPRPHGANLP